MTTQANTMPSEPSVPRPWLRYIAIVLCIIGIGIAVYLASAKLADTELACVDTGSLDCNAVQSSAYSEIMGVPISILGLSAYVAFIILLVLETRVDLIADYGRMAMFGMALFGVVYSAYLTYIEAFVLEKWCQYCIASAIIMVSLFVISTIRALSFDDDEYEDEE